MKRIKKKGRVERAFSLLFFPEFLLIERCGITAVVSMLCLFAFLTLYPTLKKEPERGMKERT